MPNICFYQCTVNEQNLYKNVKIIENAQFVQNYLKKLSPSQ